jgi:hypothetical protein
MVTVTWRDGDNPPEAFTIPDAVLAALEKFRLSDRLALPTNGMYVRQLQPRYATVEEMLVAAVHQLVVKQALEYAPTPEIVQLRAKVEAAQKELADAHAAAVGLAAPATSKTSAFVITYEFPGSGSATTQVSVTTDLSTDAMDAAKLKFIAQYPTATIRNIAEVTNYGKN